MSRTTTNQDDGLEVAREILRPLDHGRQPPGPVHIADIVPAVEGAAEVRFRVERVRQQLVELAMVAGRMTTAELDRAVAILERTERAICALARAAGEARGIKA